MEGFAIARGSVLGVIDADLSHPPEMLPTMLRALADTGSDVVVGSRYIPGGGTKNWPIGRLIMSRLACALARPITPVRDATSGFFLIGRESIRDVQIVSGGFKICLELVVRSGPRAIAEVPYVFTDRTSGESKMNWREASGYLRQLGMLWRYERQMRRPRPKLLSGGPPARTTESVNGLRRIAVPVRAPKVRRSVWLREPDLRPADIRHTLAKERCAPSCARPVPAW